MNTLAAELENLRDIVAALPTRRILPGNQMRPTRRMLERVLKALDIVAGLPETRMEEVKRAIVAAQGRRQDLATLPFRELRDAAWLLWPDAADGVDRQQLRRAFFAHMGRRKSMLRRLIDVWLQHFLPSDGTFVDAGRQIDRHLAADHTGLLAHWKESHRAYDLFDATTGPRQLATRILQESDGQTLAACRLAGPARGTSGYVRAVHAELSAQLPKRLITSPVPALANAIRFYAPDGQLRFDEQKPNGAMADAMVGPWVSKQKNLSEGMQKEVLVTLRQHLGDPRVDSRRRWADATEETRRTVRGWLSKLSLDAFFNVVGQFAQNAGMDHQWKAREAFWSVCLRKDFIQDSWLVLGDNVAKAVAHNRELRGSHGYLSGGDANHSVLLMQIGNLTFAEWSHNGKVRAWASDWNAAPSLFAKNYSREMLTAPGAQFPPPANRRYLPVSGTDGVSHFDGVWQGRVAALLQKKEGLQILPSEWQAP